MPERTSQPLQPKERLQVCSGAPIAIYRRKRRKSVTVRAIFCPECAKEGRKEKLTDTGRRSWECQACGYAYLQPMACSVCGVGEMRDAGGYWSCKRCLAELMPGDAPEQDVVIPGPRMPTSREIREVMLEDMKRGKKGGGHSGGGRKRKKPPARRGRTILDETPTRNEQPKGYRRTQRPK